MHFYFHLSWNCDDRASGRQRHLEERPPLNPLLHDFNHDPSLEGSLRRDLNELPQVRCGSSIHRHVFKDMNWPPLWWLDVKCIWIKVRRFGSLDIKKHRYEGKCAVTCISKHCARERRKGLVLQRLWQKDRRNAVGPCDIPFPFLSFFLSFFTLLSFFLFSF